MSVSKVPSRESIWIHQNYADESCDDIVGQANVKFSIEILDNVNAIGHRERKGFGCGGGI